MHLAEIRHLDGSEFTLQVAGGRRKLKLEL